MSMMRICAGRLSPAGPQARLSVLIFHRVAQQVDPLFPDEVDARRFDEILGWVRKWFNVLPLDAAVDQLAIGALPPRALAITFDDGYADNHDIALPILVRHGLSATFFVATNFLDGGRMWNDTIIEAIRRFRGDRFDLEALGLGCADTSSLTARRSLIPRLLEALKHLPPARRASLTEEIASRCANALPDDLMMTSTQLRALRRAKMTIGAHTLSHPILATLDPKSAWEEIEGSKHRLETLVGERVTLFAYPNGKPDRDYRTEHVEMVRAAGYKAAVSTAPGIASGQGDLLQLPRFTPWDRSEFRFGLRLLANLRHVEISAARPSSGEAVIAP